MKAEKFQSLTHTQKTTRKGRISLFSNEIPYWLYNMNEEDIPEIIQLYIHKQKKKTQQVCYIFVYTYTYVWMCICIHIYMYVCKNNNQKRRLPIWE